MLAHEENREVQEIERAEKIIQVEQDSFSTFDIDFGLTSCTIDLPDMGYFLSDDVFGF